MTFEEKRRLSHAMGQLSGERLVHVLRIIAQGPSAPVLVRRSLFIFFCGCPRLLSPLRPAHPASLLRLSTGGAGASRCALPTLARTSLPPAA
jgi:hypothetical protein